jgi:HEPN superfamily Toprim-like protein
VAVGSVYSLKVGDIEVLWGKNYLNDEVLLPFQGADLLHEEASGEPTLHEYRASAATVARRLDLLGHSMARARRSYSNGVRALEEWERERWPGQLLHDDGFERWCQTILACARAVQDGRTGDPLNDHPPHWEEALLGFPGGGFGDVLRALVEVVPAETLVTLDLTDMLLGGWIRDDADLFRDDGRMPLIILTEGASDSRLLGETIATLHSELSDFVRFIDYETASPQGGTDSLIQFVKMFVGCGIPNRIVVLFDNDAAGHQALWP